MQIAITGATGHLGAALVRVLAADGHQIRVLVREDTRALRGLTLETVRGDLLRTTDLDQLMRNAEVVFHLAARISLDGDHRGEVFRTNVLGTREVMAACVRAGVRRLIHFGSVHAFQAPSADQVFDESCPLAGPDAYAYERSKGQALGEVLDMGRSGQLETIALCPTAVIGPWDVKPSRQGGMLHDLWRGRLPFLPRGGFNWVDSRDVGRAAAAAMTAGTSGEAYLLSGQYATVEELALMSREIIDRPIPVRIMPDAVLNTIAPLATWWSRWRQTEPVITREALDHLRNGHPRISHQRASADLGFYPRPLEKTLLDTWQWFSQSSS